MNYNKQLWEFKMAKIIAIVAGICVIIAAGVAVYFIYSKPSEKTLKFAEKYEKQINVIMDYISNEIGSDYSLRNNVKLKFKPFKCIAKNSKVICRSDRFYIGLPFASVDLRNNIISTNFKGDSKVVLEVSSDGVFDLESNPYTNSFKTDVGGKCSYTSTYDKENGVFDTVVSDCKSNFGSLILNIMMEESQRSENFKNKDIYDAYSSYLQFDNIEKLFKYNEEDMLANEEDISNILEDIDIERKWDNIYINIYSSKGIFDSIYEYTNLISKKKIEKEEIHEVYEDLRKYFDKDLSYDNKDEEEKELLKLLEDALIAIDRVIYDGHKNFNVELTAKEKDDKYYSFETYNEVIDNFNIKIYSNN